MPYTNGVYTNPGWANNAPPPLNANNLNDISSAIEGLQTKQSYISNHNYIDNWYFANPVQQGLPNYELDRWYLIKEQESSYGWTSVSPNGFSFSSSGAPCRFIMNQKLEAREELYGKEFRFSCIVTDNSLTEGFSISFGYGESVYDQPTVSESIYISDGTVGLFQTYGIFPELSGNQRYIVSIDTGSIQAGKTVTVLAVKLEIGDNQTLGYKDYSDKWNVISPPSYTEELIKCQRYGFVIDSQNFVNSAGAISNKAYVGYARTGQLFINTPVTLRALPSITLEGDNILRIWRDGASNVADITSLTPILLYPNGIICGPLPDTNGFVGFASSTTKRQKIIILASL